MKEEIESVSRFYTIVVEFLTNYSFQILGAIIIFTIGLYVAKYVEKYALKLLLKTTLDETIGGFIAKFLRVVVIVMMAVLALGKLGISIAPFIAALGAISLTAGLALQGSVSNFAAGLVLIATKPFKIGDTITVHSIYGEVSAIKLAYTVMINEDKEQITIPNKYMIGDVLVNSFEKRLVEGSVGIAYDSDAQKAIQIIKDALHACVGVSSENEAIVGIEAFGDSSINIGYRYWVPTNSYFKTQYAANLQVLEALNEAKIAIPFPQREVKILSGS